MMLKNLPFALLLAFSPSAALAQGALGDGLSDAEQERVAELLLAHPCDCGCGMNVAQCLNDDPSCETSKEIATEVIASLLAARPPATGLVTPAPPATALPELQSDGGEWYRRVSGKLLVYISSGGGYRTKDCTWLYKDGTFTTNSQSGSVTSLGSHAAQGGNRGRWSARGNVLTLLSPDGSRQVYSMSFDQEGTFYLDHWRYFIVEHDNETCR